jgi:2-C-methyl-D-erythritol 2,4-cyclodiphosphate synthase
MVFAPLLPVAGPTCRRTPPTRLVRTPTVWMVLGAAFTLLLAAAAGSTASPGRLWVRPTLHYPQALRALVPGLHRRLTFERPAGAGLREGDVGETGGEAFFPKAASEVVPATGESLATEPPMRIGHGWDLHRLASLEEAGQGCVIGGVAVPGCDFGVVAHSDGDVLYHSLTDALLGALGLPDIGQLFPDNDPRWRGAASEAFLAEAVRLMERRGYRVMNADVTLILQKPRVAPIKGAMKDNVVRVLRTVPARVNIKARTHEKVDSIGEGRALSCHVVVLLERIASL